VFRADELFWKNSSNLPSLEVISVIHPKLPFIGLALDDSQMPHIQSK
jgi:hypothetical protein